jgi:hypothetical protein
LSCSCGKNASYRRVTPKHLLTTVGTMNVGRRYYACRHCGRTYAPWDAWAGVSGRQVTVHAKKLIVTMSSGWSFDRVSQKLDEVCLMRVSDDTIERVCQDEGQGARKWLSEAAEPVKAFEAAAGRPEFYSDGLKVNTVGGWREMRLNLLQKRESADPCEPGGWKQRVLPDASVRLATCAIATSQIIGASWKKQSERMGLGESKDLSVIGDGAAWIWEQAAQRLSPQASWCVDIYHVSEHLHACGKEMMGEGEAARTWAEDRLSELIERSGPRFIAKLDEQLADEQDEGRRQALASLRTYLDGNRNRMWYAQRLREGLPIGSGAIEGGCKKIGSRMKLNSARWRVRRAERFGALLCLEYSDRSTDYWHLQAA